MIEWPLDADMQRRAGLGLNRGEAHHALKSAQRIRRQGEIRDRTSGARHFRIAGLNLLTAIIIHWNTEKPGHAVRERELAGLDTPSDLFVHVSPLGWAHVPLTGERRWRRTMASRAWRTFSPSTGIDPFSLASFLPCFACMFSPVEQGSRSRINHGPRMQESGAGNDHAGCSGACAETKSGISGIKNKLALTTSSAAFYIAPIHAKVR